MFPVALIVSCDVQSSAFAFFCVFIYLCKNLQYSSLIVNMSSLLDDKLHMLIVM